MSTPKSFLWKIRLALCMLIAATTVSCLENKKSEEDFLIPNLTAMMDLQIKMLNQQHEVLFLNSSGGENLESLKKALESLKRFDVDSTKGGFQKFLNTCNGIEQKVWKHNGFTLSFSTFVLSEKENVINLDFVEINSKDFHAEFLIPNNEPLEYLNINTTKYNPSYVDRLVGLDKAIGSFKRGLHECRKSFERD